MKPIRASLESADSARPQLPRLGSRSPAWIVLAVSLAVTVSAWRVTQSKVDADSRTRLRARVELIRQALLTRLESYESTLRAGAALLAVSTHATQQDWSRFVQSLNLRQDFPGLTQLAALRRRGDRDTASPPSLQQHSGPPASENAGQLAELRLQFAAPDNTPSRPSGFDLATVPEYRLAAAKASDSGRVRVSACQPSPYSNCAVEPALFLPLYELAREPLTEPERRAALTTWLVGWFEPQILLGAVEPSLLKNIHLQVFAGDQLDASHRIYDSEPALPGQAVVFSERLPVDVFGSPWTLAAGAKGEFASSESAPVFVFVGGLLSSLILFVVTDSLSSSRLRALALAKMMTQRLRENEARSRAVVENAPVGIITHASDGSIETVNAAAERMFGYHSHELAGCTFDDLLAEPVHFNDSVIADFVTFREETGRRADGTTFPIEMSVRPMQVGDARMFTAIVVDITEQHQAAEALRAERDFSSAVLNLAPTLVMVVDGEGMIVAFNRACEQATNYRFKEVEGRLFWDLFILPEERERVQTVFEELRSGLYPNQHESHWLSKDGRRRLIAWSNTVLPDPRARARYLISCGVDITEQRRAEQERDRYVVELERAQHTTEQQAEMLAQQAEELAAARDAALETAQLKSQFLANMSHEIRTPMSGVLGMVRLLLNTKLDAEQIDYAETIFSSAEALLVIINDILDFSKIEAGKLQFETVDFNLAKTVEGSLQLLREQAAHKKIDLVSSIALGTPVWVCGDPGRLRQVLLNLIGNAIKFTERGRVEVALTVANHTDEHVELAFSVRDTGIGIAPEVYRNLFRPFVQADGTTSRKYGGTGLGLAISQQLVHRMGGEIGCESDPGKGSRFWFTVKLGRFKAHAVPQLKGLQALVLAEHAADRNRFRRILSSWEILASSAASGGEALQILIDAQARLQPFDVVVAQNSEPESVLTFAESVRSHPEFAAVPVIALGLAPDGPCSEKLRELDIHLGRGGTAAASELFDWLAGLQGHLAMPLGPVSALAPAPRAGLPPHSEGIARKILLVEDNLVNQKVALRMLQNLGCFADAVGNGLEALKALDRASYDLILMDCQMPEMDGYQATAEIRRREIGALHIPIVALTAHAMQGARERCIEAGMDDYLSKPIDPQALAAALLRWGALPAPDHEDTVEAREERR